jgi:hypothetical protein
MSPALVDQNVDRPALRAERPGELGHRLERGQVEPGDPDVAVQQVSCGVPFGRGADRHEDGVARRREGPGGLEAAAGANKALIYSYFGNKDQLFDIVFNALVVGTVHDVPIDVDDLPAYAGRLFDRNLSHPHALRLAIWRSLERGEAVPDAVAAPTVTRSR